MTDSTSIFSEMSREAAIERGLGRIEGKMDILLTQFANHAVDDKGQFMTLDKRMDSMEKRYVWFTGVWSGIVVVVSSIVYGLIYFISKG